MLLVKQPIWLIILALSRRSPRPALTPFQPTFFIQLTSRLVLAFILGVLFPHKQRICLLNHCVAFLTMSWRCFQRKSYAKNRLIWLTLSDFSRTLFKPLLRSWMKSAIRAKWFQPSMHCMQQQFSEFWSSSPSPWFLPRTGTFYIFSCPKPRPAWATKKNITFAFGKVSPLSLAYLLRVWFWSARFWE